MLDRNYNSLQLSILALDEKEVNADAALQASDAALRYGISVKVPVKAAWRQLHFWLSDIFVKRVRRGRNI